MRPNFLRKNGNSSSLKYGMIHCRFGDPEGVSIVMKQVEGMLCNYLDVPKENIHYLIGQSKIKSPQITESPILWDYTKINRIMQEYYEEGFGGGMSELIEYEINRAKKEIEIWVKRKNLDVLIVHNSSHPVNFVSSVAISRYYRDAMMKGEKTPKYVLWWHDSHLERQSFLNPSKDVERYLIQGVPGPYVDYILFINSTQFGLAKDYFKKVDDFSPGFLKKISSNYEVAYNTTRTFIDRFEELNTPKFNSKVSSFLNDFRINQILKNNNFNLSDLLFVLQPTRIVQRKRIDFALEYSYALLDRLKKNGLKKALYFLVSGHSADKTRDELLKLNDKLSKKYGTDKLFIVFAEDYYDFTSLEFEDYPLVFAKLKGIATYFSEVEGFGNNLLEVLASGLPTAVYEYPVFHSDISKFKFDLVQFSEYKMNLKKVDEMISIIKDVKKRERIVNHNLKILKENFSHKTLARKLRKAIL